MRTVDGKFLVSSVLHKDVLPCPEPSLLVPRDQAVDAAPVLPAPTHRVREKTTCAVLGETWPPEESVTSTPASDGMSGSCLAPTCESSNFPSNGSQQPHTPSSSREVCVVSVEEVLNAEDRQASILAEAHPFDLQAARSFLGRCHWASKAVRGTLRRGATSRSEVHCIFGLFRHGGVLGMTRNSERFQGFLRLLVRLVSVLEPKFRYTSLALVTQATVTIVTS